jgi:hypothetical protein
MMAWYTIPKVKVKYVYDEAGAEVGVLLDAADFEKLVEKMEDFLDNEVIEQDKQEENPRFYTHEEIKKMIANKKR